MVKNLTGKRKRKGWGTQFLASAQSSHQHCIIYTVRAHSMGQQTHRMLWKLLTNRHLTIRMSVHSNRSLHMKVLCTYYREWDRKTTSLASGRLYNNIVISEMKAIMWLNKLCFNARAGKCINHNIISVSFLSIYKSRTRSWLEWFFLNMPLPLNFCLLEPF